MSELRAAREIWDSLKVPAAQRAEYEQCVRQVNSWGPEQSSVTCSNKTGWFGHPLLSTQFNNRGFYAISLSELVHVELDHTRLRIGNNHIS